LRVEGRRKIGEPGSNRTEGKFALSRIDGRENKVRRASVEILKHIMIFRSQKKGETERA